MDYKKLIISLFTGSQDIIVDKFVIDTVLSMISNKDVIKKALKLWYDKDNYNIEYLIGFDNNANCDLGGGIDIDDYSLIINVKYFNWINSIIVRQKLSFSSITIVRNGKIIAK